MPTHKLIHFAWTVNKADQCASLRSSFIVLACYSLGACIATENNRRKEVPTFQAVKDNFRGIRLKK